MYGKCEKPSTKGSRFTLICWTRSLRRSVTSPSPAKDKRNKRHVGSIRPAFDRFPGRITASYTRFMSTSQRELPRSADFFRGGRPPLQDPDVVLTSPNAAAELELREPFCCSGVGSKKLRSIAGEF